jgi:hypothetical protein
MEEQNVACEQLMEEVSQMNNEVRLRKRVFQAMMAMWLWSGMPMMLPSVYSQPVPPSPAPVEPVPPPTVTPPPTVPQTEAERAAEAERLRQAERARSSELTETRVEHKKIRPSESYVAGFGGYTFGGKFNDVETTGPLGGLFPGANRPDRDLANSGVYGGKIGHFFGDRLNWLGVEMEAFNTTPHVEQQGPIPGDHLRVTTLAFNVIGRLKFGCETKIERTEPRPDLRSEIRYEREFCRLQPYAGVGLGVFFANLKGNGIDASDNAVPGLNVLGGVRYYFTERVAMFAEYKYNRATFDFDQNALGGGVKGDYSINHVVGGLSFHF